MSMGQTLQKKGLFRKKQKKTVKVNPTAVESV